MRTKKNSDHYSWGSKCSGWHLLKSNHLHIIEEMMPPNTQEEKHYHNFSEQFFYILKGEATFEVEGQSIELKEREGLHINPKIIHQIKNLGKENLEFVLVSQPSAHGDRINEPFEKESDLNLNGKIFKGLENSDNGEVDATTLFNYRQDKDIVWATYQGGDIKFGTLNGKIIGSNLEFYYQHQNRKGDFMTGKCQSEAKVINGKIRLFETWEWTSGDLSKGTSILEEI